MVNFKSAYKTVFNQVKAHQSGIMTGGGIFLMVAGTAVAVYAGIKTSMAAAEVKQQKIEEATDIYINEDGEVDAEMLDQYNEAFERELSKPLTVKEMTPVVWKYWMTPVLLEILGAILIIGAQKHSLDKIMALTAALGYKISETDDLKSAIKEVVGEEKAEEIEKRIDKKRAEEAKENGCVIETGRGNVKFYDYYGSRPFYSSHEFLKKAENEFNKELNLEAKFRDGGLSINDWYYKIGLDPIPYYDNLKWNIVGTPEERTELAELDISWSEEDEWFVVKFKRGHAPTWDASMMF